MRASIFSLAIMMFAVPCVSQQAAQPASQSAPAANPASAKPAATAAKPAAEDPATAQKTADIRKLMGIMGMSDMISRVLNATIQDGIESAKKLRPDIPPEFWESFRLHLAQELHPDELIEQIVPVYEKHFSDDDIRAAIDFYQSPAGKKFVSELPQIQAESMEIGQAWGEALGKRIGEQAEAEMRAKGYKSGQPPKPAKR